MVNYYPNNNNSDNNSNNNENNNNSEVINNNSNNDHQHTELKNSSDSPIIEGEVAEEDYEDSKALLKSPLVHKEKKIKRKDKDDKKSLATDKPSLERIDDDSETIDENSVVFEPKSTAIEMHYDEPVRKKDPYDVKKYLDYRKDHLPNGGSSSIDDDNGANSSDKYSSTQTIDPEMANINDIYEEQKKRAEAKKKSRWTYFKYLYNKNSHRWDIKKNTRFYLAAQFITRIGFTAKFFLYFTLGLISMVAAVDKKRDPLGPAAAFEELQEILSGGAIFLLVIGLWCYGCWGLFFVIFDIDQLGHASAGAILKRFGRVFSSGFYFVLGVNAIQVLSHTRGDKEGTEQILTLLYKNIVGKIIVCVLGVTFFVVSIVYLVYFVVPNKFKRELSTERMTRGLYYASLAFARIGAIGRSMFFGAFGGVLIKAVHDINQGEEGDTTLLGFQGVFRSIAKFNYTLLFVIATLIVVYAFWCLWLVFFRRLPAHKDAKMARQLLGSKINHDFHFNGILLRVPRSGTINLDDVIDNTGMDENNDDNNNNNTAASGEVLSDSSTTLAFSRSAPRQEEDLNKI